MYEDKKIVCKECQGEFVFSAGEQEFFEDKGFVNNPQRCKPCRDLRKSSVKASREYFFTTCAKCGGEAKVPFQPRDGREVLCSECFAQEKEFSPQS